MNFRLDTETDRQLRLAPEFQLYLPPAPRPGPRTGQAPPPVSTARPSAGARQREFFQRMLPHALAAQALTGVPASVSLAQAALESGWGRHAPGHNFFGIKGTGPAGSQRLATREFRDGALVRTHAKFRRYHDPLESFLDHARVIAEGRYLRHAMKHKDKAHDFVRALQSGRYKYATDPRYADKVIQLIEVYGLTRYDRSAP
ncbi:MAG: glycoside hydrolase family 73 protein [Deltaproteobacteria bacterium]|nr:glycoside hydrolase family 73 protein [Deltaproteobacteria bacterium]